MLSKLREHYNVKPCDWLGYWHVVCSYSTDHEIARILIVGDTVEAISPVVTIDTHWSEQARRVAGLVGWKAIDKPLGAGVMGFGVKRLDFEKDIVL